MNSSFFVSFDPFFGKSKSYSYTTDTTTAGIPGFDYNYTVSTTPSFEKMEQVLNDVFEDFLGKKTKTNSISEALGKVNFPKIDLYSNGEEAIFLASVPGYKKEDLEVELVKNVLVISAKDSALESQLDNMVKVHGEIKKSKFTREIALNEDVLDLKDVNKLKISLEDGILKIVIPYNEDKIVKRNTLKIK